MLFQKNDILSDWSDPFIFYFSLISLLTFPSLTFVIILFFILLYFYLILF